MSMEVNRAYSSNATTYSGVAEAKTGKQPADARSRISGLGAFCKK